MSKLILQYFFRGEGKIDLNEGKKKGVKKIEAEFKCLFFDCKNKILFSNIQKISTFFYLSFDFLLNMIILKSS